MFTSFDESLVQLAEYYREHGMSEADIKSSIDGYKEMFRMMKIIMPGAFLICAPIMAFVNYIAAKKILTKLGDSFESYIGFQYRFYTSVDCSYRCIKQVGNFPNGHPYFAIRNMDAMSVVCYDSSFHRCNLFQWNLIGRLSFLYIDQICVDLSSGNVLVG